MESQDTSNYIELIGFFLITIFFTAGAILGFSRAQIPLAILSLFLAALGAYRVINCLKRGLRAPNRYEWFKYWMMLRPILFGLIVLGAIWVFAVNGRDWLGDAAFESNPIMIGLALAALLMVALIIYFASRAPYRRETDDMYKARIGWKEHK